MTENETVTIKKDTLWKVIAGIFALLFVVTFVNNLGSGNQPAVPTGAAVAAPSPGAQQPNPTVNVDMKTLADNDPFIGNANAKVVVVEFSDFQCPFCRKFHDETWLQLKTNYIDTGKIKFVYRDFPLSFHQNAEKAAEASECAHEQGKFWEMFEVLFKNSQGDGTGLNTADLKKYAADLGLDTTKFNSCLDSSKYASEIQKDEQDGGAVGVQGTPSFIINGQLIAGAYPYSAFQQAIDTALAKV